MSWFVYMLRCKDGTLYTGATTDTARRVAEHNSVRGAKYTKGKGPVRLVYRESHKNRSGAQMREAQIKKLSRAQKEHLIGTQQ